MSDDLVIAFLLKNTIEVAAKKQRAFIHIYIKNSKKNCIFRVKRKTTLKLYLRLIQKT